MNVNKKESPIRIAYIIGKMWAGGVETVVFNYYRAINHDKFQFDFYYDEDSTVEPPQDLIEMGARFIKLPPYQNLPMYLKELRIHLKKEKYTIVHSHLNTLSVFPLYAAWKEHVPIRIAHNHSVPGGKEFGRNIAKQILRRFSKLFSTDYFACSEKAGRWMFGNTDFDNGKVFVMKNAVDFEKFVMSEEEISTRKKSLGIDGKVVVGHIGRFTYAKNHKFLLNIFMEMRKQNSSTVLLLVGDGELHDEIVGYINKLGLNEAVVLTGKVRDPENYYKLNDVIVLPSIFEGLSMTAVESQVAGVPCLISNAIPKEAIISDGCLSLDINDAPETWAENAFKLVNKNISYSHNKNDYDIRIQVKKLEKWYSSKIEQCTQ